MTETIIDESSLSEPAEQSDVDGNYGLAVGAVFANWLEFKSVMEMYERNAHVKLIFADTRKIETANVGYRREGAPLYDEKFKYAYARVTCKHHGKYRSKGSGKRPNQRSYKTNCPMHFIVSVDRSKDRMYIRSGDFTHNHPTDEDVAKLYPENRRLSKSEKQFSKILMDMKVPIKVFRERVREMSQKPLTNKDIYNLQAKLRKEMAEEEKTEVQSLLHELQDITEKDSGSEVVVNVDANGQIQVVFFQTSYMKEAYLKFPEVCIIGDTDEVNANGMILCTIIVQDGSGTFIPCSHFLLAKLDDTTMNAAFQLFKQPLDTDTLNKTNLFIVGSNNLDVCVFETHFPSASVKLCESQVLKTFKNETANVENSGTPDVKPRKQTQLWATLHAMVMSKTEEEYEQLRTNLCSICVTSGLAFGSAFNETWHQQRHLWVGAWRNKDRNYGISSSNCLASFHEKVKNVVDGSSSVAECVRGILKIDNRLKLDSDRKKLQAMMATSSKIIDNAELDEMNKLCTNYAVGLVQKEFKASDNVTISKNEDQQLIATDKCGDVVVKDKENVCSCHFYTNYNLPCRHIFGARKFQEKKLFEASLFEVRWHRNYQHSECKVDESSTSASTSASTSQGLNASISASPSVKPKGKRSSSKQNSEGSATPTKKSKIEKQTQSKKGSLQLLSRDEKYSISTLLCRQIAGIISEVPQKQFENKLKILKSLCSHWLGGEEVRLIVKPCDNKKLASPDNEDNETNEQAL